MTGIGTTPSVSVVMAVKNYPRYLRLAMDSILHQALEDLEFIVVDYGSTDDTMDIVRSFEDPRVNLIEYPGLGFTEALNVGVAAARGDYIARQDADDVSHQCRLRAQVEYLNTHDDVDILGTGLKVCNEEGETIYVDSQAWSHDLIANQMLYDCPLPHSSVMARSEVFNNFCYDEEMYCAQDYGLWLDILKNSTYRFAILPDILYIRLHHGACVTSERRTDQLACAYHALEKHVYGRDLPIAEAKRQLVAHRGRAARYDHARQHRDRFWNGTTILGKAISAAIVTAHHPAYWLHEARKSRRLSTSGHLKQACETCPDSKMVFEARTTNVHPVEVVPMFTCRRF